MSTDKTTPSKIRRARWGALAGGVAAVALLSGCAGPGRTAAPDAPVRAGYSSYGTVVELRDALMAAGYPCVGWREVEASNFAAQTGACESVVMSTYATDTDKSQSLDRIREISHMAGGIDTSGMSGPNWLMLFKTTQSATDAQAKFGGTVVNFAAAE